MKKKKLLASKLCFLKGKSNSNFRILILILLFQILCITIHTYIETQNFACKSKFALSYLSATFVFYLSRAVVFRLFQKTVILPPNPVGFRLTYTQL